MGAGCPVRGFILMKIGIIAVGRDGTGVLSESHWADETI